MSGQAPNFSFVLPVRNGEAYIDIALRSILDQTYQQFEVIVLDNCSTDETQAIANSYKDERIRLQLASAPLSMEASWGRILDLDLQEYMTVLGHDDVFYPEFLDEVVRLMEYQPGASLYCTHFHIIDSEGRLIRPCKPVPFRESAESLLQGRHRFERDIFGTGYVMRSADYRRVGGLPPFPNLIYADDVGWYNVARLSYKVCSPRHLFAYRYHRGSTAITTDLEAFFQASNMYLTSLAESGYLASQANAAAARGFVKIKFNGRRQRFLANLIASADGKRRIQEYRELKARMAAEGAANQQFSTDDWVAEILELVALIPSSFLQRLILHGIEIVAKATRGLRNSDLTFKQ